MTEEYLEVVDDNNTPTGVKKLRSEIHRDGDWHRTVHIYVFRIHIDRVEILAHKRSDFKDMDPGKWDMRFGGHVQFGEKVGEAAESELEEEIGINISAMDLIDGGWKTRELPREREFSKVYFYEYNDDLTKLHFKDDEVQEVQWISEEKFLASCSDKSIDWGTGICNEMINIFADLKNIIKNHD